MTIDFSNYINTYKGSPVLQQQFPNMNDYLALFGYQGSTPSSATTSTTPSTPSTSSGVQGIINQNINQFQQGGGEGITGLQQTFTSGAQPRGPKFDPNINPAFTLTGKGRLDPMGSDIDYFQSFRAQNDPRAFTSGLSIDNVGSDSRYFEEPSMINRGITAVTDFFSGLGTPKVRGTLGTRLANQKMLPIPLPSMITAQARNPLMAGAANFNPALEGQLNYLEGQDGYIGRDPNSGGLKYGPESVLSGQNVISGFGTNDYVKQLDKYINKMIERGTVDDEFAEENLSKFQLEKLKKARIEKQNFLDSAIYKTQQEEIRKQQEARRQEVQNLQNRIDRGDFDSTSGIPDRDRSTVTAASAAKTSKVGGGGYTASDSKRDAARGRYDDGGRVYLYNRLK